MLSTPNTNFRLFSALGSPAKDKTWSFLLTLEVNISEMVANRSTVTINKIQFILHGDLRP